MRAEKKITLINIFSIIIVRKILTKKIIFFVHANFENDWGYIDKFNCHKIN